MESFRIDLHTACKSACFVWGVATPSALCVCSNTVINLGIMLEKSGVGMVELLEVSMVVVVNKAIPTGGLADGRAAYALWLCLSLSPFIPFNRSTSLSRDVKSIESGRKQPHSSAVNHLTDLSESH